MSERPRQRRRRSFINDRLSVTRQASSGKSLSTVDTAADSSLVDMSQYTAKILRASS